MLSKLGRNRNDSKDMIFKFAEQIFFLFYLFCIFGSWLAQIYAPDNFCASINSHRPLKHNTGPVLLTCSLLAKVSIKSNLRIAKLEAGLWRSRQLKYYKRFFVFEGVEKNPAVGVSSLACNDNLGTNDGKAKKPLLNAKNEQSYRKSIQEIQSKTEIFNK